MNTAGIVAHALAAGFGPSQYDGIAPAIIKPQRPGTSSAEKHMLKQL